ncbi:hypothetical protein B296_00000431 [Ensete ventricosum]|uniref:Uncharacterized protein n=1 Tax=Ensete ventricosum TaxID=4639 RepID=A0A427BCD4_ENSVE|nr:hypothetical protein B296_00000431 [Ensete ventricosum]
MLGDRSHRAGDRGGATLNRRALYRLRCGEFSRGSRSALSRRVEQNLSTPGNGKRGRTLAPTTRKRRRQSTAVGFLIG